jgi:hypothetical protein
MFALSMIAFGVRAAAFEIRLADLFRTRLDPSPADQPASGTSFEQDPVPGGQFGVTLRGST